MEDGKNGKNMTYERSHSSNFMLRKTKILYVECNWKNITVYYLGCLSLSFLSRTVFDITVNNKKMGPVFLENEAAFDWIRDY